MTTVWPNLPSAIWSNEDELLRQLAEAAKLVAEISSYSMDRGVYAFFSLVKGFLTLGGRVFAANNGTPLYIGKTESSQKARDAGQHLSDEGTGSSTRRRSLGAILLEHLRLKPEPRSDSETSERRFTNYKFDKAGEEQLTKWMDDHLSLAFCELPKLTIPELRAREERLIRSAAPPLLLDYLSGALLC
jgi:GIY-YIG catalytic domain